jgi:hypothetical protein
MRAAMAQAVRASRAASFVHAFLARPSHEMLYYTFAHAVASGHAIASGRAVGPRASSREAPMMPHGTEATNGGGTGARDSTRHEARPAAHHRFVTAAALEAPLLRIRQGGAGERAIKAVAGHNGRRSAPAAHDPTLWRYPCVRTRSTSHGSSRHSHSARARTASMLCAYTLTHCCSPHCVTMSQVRCSTHGPSS